MSEPATRTNARTPLEAGVGKEALPKASRAQELSPRYAERIRALEKARNKAEKAAREAQAELARITRVMSAGQFASWIAHEINQPIAAIVTNGDAALRWLARETPDLQEVEAAVQRIIRDASRAASVVDVTRAMLAKDKPDFCDVDLNQVVEEALLLTQAEQRRSQVSVQMSLAADLPPVKGNRVQLQQVVLNLVLNGIDAMKSIEGRSRVLFVKSDVVRTGDILILVEDSGTGIDPANVEQLFEHYFTTKAFGMGLGLPISRSIVEAHGGRLWASPAAVNGAAFQFTLPRSAEHRDAHPMAAAFDKLAS